MTRQDRATVAATAIVAAIVRHVRSTAVFNEIAEMLREQFHEIQQQTLNEMRPDEPPN